MSLRKIMTLLQSSVNEETSNLRRSSRVRRSLVETDASPESESEEELPRKDPTGRCKNKKKKKKRKCLAAEQEQQIPEPPLVTAGHEMPIKEIRDGAPVVEHPSTLDEEKPRCHKMPIKEIRDGVPVVEHPSSPEEEKPRCHEMPHVETRDGVPVVELPSPEQEKPIGHEMPCGETRAVGPIVEIPSSPEEEKSKINLLFLLEEARKPNSQQNLLSELREHLLNAASVLKYKLVTRLTSDNLRTKDMIILANRCFNALIELEDDYTYFHSEVKKLIAQHQEVEFSAIDKESWNDRDIKARYVQQVQCLNCVGEKLSSAQDKLTTAKAKVDSLKLKKLELLRVLTEELYEEEERVKILTVERDQIQESHSDIKVGLQKLDAEKAEASVAFKAIDAQYNAAKKKFERMSNHLMQLVMEF